MSLTALKPDGTAPLTTNEHRCAVLMQVRLVVDLQAAVDVGAVGVADGTVEVRGTEASLLSVLRLVGLAFVVCLAVDFAGLQLGDCVFAWEKLELCYFGMSIESGLDMMKSVVDDLLFKI